MATKANTAGNLRAKAYTPPNAAPAHGRSNQTILRSGSPAQASVRQTVDGPGKPLDPHTRAFLEPRLAQSISSHGGLAQPPSGSGGALPLVHKGHRTESEADHLSDRINGSPDSKANHPAQSFGLGDIRVHTDDRAAASARSLNARAYTVGNDIVFGSGFYAPHSTAGMRLLSHEVVHAAQQRGGPPAIQRAGDLDITGVNPATKHDPSKIYFDKDSAAIPSTEDTKIATLASGKADLALNGSASEDEAADGNSSIVKKRTDAVESALKGAGFKGTVKPGSSTVSTGQMNYRRARTVTITPATASPTRNGCAATKDNPNPADEKCGAEFETARSTAATMVDTAIGALATPTSSTKAAVDKALPKNSTSTALTRLKALQDQIKVMAPDTGHQCHNDCDPTCTRVGYMNGIQGPKAQITLCPGFFQMPKGEEVKLLLHEGLHATLGAPIIDRAYEMERIIRTLSGSDAETNPDNYVHLIIALSGGPTDKEVVPPVDTEPGLSKDEKKYVDMALAFAEKWLERSESATGQLYGAIGTNAGKASWNSSDAIFALTEHSLAPLFGLSDPGAAEPFHPGPSLDDRIKVAGLHDRFYRMYVALRAPINVTKGASESWEANLGPSVVLSKDFFDETYDKGQVKRLIKLMAASMSDNPAKLAQTYAEAADKIRQAEHIGPIGKS